MYVTSSSRIVSEENTSSNGPANQLTNQMHQTKPTNKVYNRIFIKICTVNVRKPNVWISDDADNQTIDRSNRSRSVFGCLSLSCIVSFSDRLD